MTTTLANVPEVCDSFLLGGWCVPWLLAGLVLGTILLGASRFLSGLAQRGRQLDHPHNDPMAFPGTSPRVSLVRLLPYQEGKP